MEGTSSNKENGKNEQNLNRSGLINFKNSMMLQNSATLKVSRQIHFKDGDDFFEDLPDELFLQILSYVKGEVLQIYFFAHSKQKEQLLRDSQQLINDGRES